MNTLRDFRVIGNTRVAGHGEDSMDVSRRKELPMALHERNSTSKKGELRLGVSTNPEDHR